MPVTLATYALTTENKVKEQGSGIDASDPTQDEAIRFLINSASLRMMEYAGREFKDLGLGSTRTFQITPGGCGFDEVSFGANDAATISAVVIDTQLGQTGLTLTTTQYQPVPVQKWHGAYTGLHILAGATGYVPTGARRQVTVTGTWGWPSVPADVEHGCTATVLEWLTGYQVNDQEAGGFGLTATGIAVSSGALPARVRAMLDNLSQVLIA